MPDDRPAPTSRRALLAAAAGAGAAFAATAALPLTAAAADPNDVVKGATNTATAVTTLDQSTVDTDAFRATASGTGIALKGSSTAGLGIGVEGTSAANIGVMGSTDAAFRAAVVGISGDATDASASDEAFDIDSGIYGYSTITAASSGVWGESIDGYGVVGTGAIGLLAEGGLGIFADGFDGIATVSAGGVALAAHEGLGPIPASPFNTAVFATVSSPTHVGIEARGRVRFPDRSGRSRILKGKSSVSVAVAGMTSSNACIATLNSNGSGRSVRTVIPSAGKLTIYLTGPVSSDAIVAWLVLG